jgi:hypothetical protein
MKLTGNLTIGISGGSQCLCGLDYDAASEFTSSMRIAVDIY